MRGIQNVRGNVAGLVLTLLLISLGMWSCSAFEPQRGSLFSVTVDLECGQVAGEWFMSTTLGNGFLLGILEDEGSFIDAAEYRWPSSLEVESWITADGTPVTLNSEEPLPGPASYVRLGLQEEGCSTVDGGEFEFYCPRNCKQ